MSLLQLMLRFSNSFGEVASVAGVSLTEGWFTSLLASPFLSRRSQLRLWCWLVCSEASSAGYGRVEPLQDVSVSSVMISTIFDLFWRNNLSPRITIPNSGQTDFKTRKAIANVGNHQPLSESFPQAASCDNATCIHTFCNASMLSEVIETVVWKVIRTTENPSIRPDYTNQAIITIIADVMVFRVLSNVPYHAEQKLVAASGCFSSCVFPGPSDVVITWRGTWFSV